MSDIVEVFPTAEEVKQNGKEGFSLYLFEEELRSILKLIALAKARGEKIISIQDVSNETIEFLIRKGYSVDYKGKENWIIDWGE